MPNVTQVQSLPDRLRCASQVLDSKSRGVAEKGGPTYNRRVL
jgi:hypothetical protein